MTVFYESFAFCEDTSYNKKDLDVLVDQKNYIEFFRHAKDIRPSERDAIWNQNVEQMGLGLLDFLASKTRINPSELKLVKELSYWTLFKDNEFFIKKRDFYFLKDLKSCLENNSKKCQHKALSIYKDFSHDITFSNEIVNILAKYPDSFNDLWPYIKRLTKHELSEFYCNKGAMNDVIISKIFSTQNLENVLKDLHIDCIKVLAPQLNDKLLSKSEHERNRSFKILKKYNFLKPNDQVIFDTVSYLKKEKLNNKQVDEIVKSFKLINKNYTLREDVLEHLKKLDPIPDHIFQVKENAELKIKILNRYFPEFIDYYSQTCLSYLSGEKNYSTGNPTPACHDFFKNAKSVLPRPILKKYENATLFLNN